MKVAFVITSLLMVFNTSGQTLKDYYIPVVEYNKATFYQPDNKTGEPTGLTRTIYYVKKGVSYDITDAHFFEDNASSIVTKTVLISSTEVKMTKDVATNALGVTNKKTTHNPAVILLKLPPIGKSVSWTTFEGKAKNTCTASWLSVKIDGEPKKVIKLQRKIEGFTASITEYYVEGIGFWKSEIISANGKAQTTDKFDELSYDPTATEESETEAKNSNYSLITKYEKYVIDGQKPSDPNVKTKYDDRDYRAIFWSDKLSNSSSYIRQELEKLGYEYVKVTTNDRVHITYAYRNCKKNLLLNVTEWYNYKLAIDIQWFSNNVKGGIGYLMYCN